MLRDPGRDALWRRIHLLPMALAAFFLVGLGAMARDAATSGGSANPAMCVSDAELPLVGWSGRTAEEALAWGLVGSLALTWLLFRLTRGRRNAAPWLLPLTSTLAVTATVLGLFAYSAGPETGVVSVDTLGRVLRLFLGDVTPAAACPGRQPLGLEVAVVAAIGATGSGVLAAAAETWGAQWTRWRVRNAADVDVVVGAGEGEVPLVRRLVEEAREAQPSSARGHAWWPPRRGDLRRWLTARREVVVVVDDLRDPVAAAARVIGARVVVSDPHQLSDLRRIALRGPFGQRVALHRAYLLGDNPVENVQIHAAFVRLLESHSDRAHTRGAVPRLVVRMDDSREACVWRARNVLGAMGGDASPTQRLRWFCDAVSQDEIAAHELAELIESEHALDVLIAGSSPLVTALLDELAWRRWSRQDLRTRLHASPRRQGPDNRGALRSELHTPELRSVTLLGEGSEHQLREWEDTRAPWPRGSTGDDPILPVTWVAALTDWHVDAPVHHEEAGHIQIVIAVDAAPGLLSDIRRLARMDPGRTLVAIPDATADGVALLGDTARFGPTWLMGGRPPEDSWSVLARHQHAVYRFSAGLLRGTSQRVTGNPWPGPPDEPALGLPPFFQDDNLRQLRHVLHEVGRLGYTWQRVAASGAEFILRDTDLDEVAHSEHERWCALRREFGWRYCETRDDRRRLTTNLIDWSEPVREGNREQVAGILRMLAATGLVARPALLPTHRRTGEVRAHRLDEDVHWGSNGDHLTGRVGDWWVESVDGGRADGRVVAAGRFAELYAHVGEDRWRRSGVVEAWQTARTLRVPTLEGDATALTGSWVVSDGESQWPVPDDHFRRSYAPLETPS